MSEFNPFESSEQSEAPVSYSNPESEFLAREQQEFEELGGSVDEVNNMNNNYNAFEENQPPQQSEPEQDKYSSISAVDSSFSEGEALRNWRAQREQRLAEKDAAENAAKEAQVANAKKELQDWQARYEEQLVKTKKHNREAEAAFIQERDESTPGNEWERVGRLVDFNPKNAKSTKDTSRIRGIFLQLKTTPLVR